MMSRGDLDYSAYKLVLSYIVHESLRANVNKVPINSPAKHKVDMRWQIQIQALITYFMRSQ